MAQLRLMALWFVLCTGLTTSLNAHAVRGWLGLGMGAGHDRAVQTTFAVGPQFAFIIANYLVLGGRFEAYLNMSSNDDADQSFYKAFNNQRFIIAPHVMGRVPLGNFGHFYGGVEFGADMGWDFAVAMFTRDRVAKGMVGTVAGFDFFLGKHFSLGPEFEFQRIVSDENMNRYVALATFKWQFGNTEPEVTETAP